MFRKTYSSCCMSFDENVKSCICCNCGTDQFPYPPNPSCFVVSPSPLPNPWQPLTCVFNHWFPFPRITCKCNRIICNILVWLLSFRKMYLRYIRLLCESAVCPFHCGVVFNCMEGPHFVYSFTSWRIFGLFPALCYYE